MIQQIDETIFDEAGLGSLTKEEKQRMLMYVAKTLETRVGIRLTSEASKEQLEMFTKLADKGNDDEMLAWLEQVFPNYQQIVDEELREIKGELADVANDVLAARD